MTNTDLLMQYIKDSGLKLQFIADKMNISRAALNMKIHNKSEFRTGEIETLCGLVGIEGVNERHKVFFWNQGR